MRKQLLMGLLLMAFGQSRAQTEKGVGLWSGNVGLNRGSSSQFQLADEQRNLTIGLTQGTFVQTDLLLGADLRLTRSRDIARRGLNFDSQSDNRQTTLGLAPFLRRFWGKQTWRGYVGGGLLVEYSINRLLTTNTRTRTAEDLTTQWRVRPEVQAGVLYVIGPRWGAELSARSSVAPLAFTDVNLGLVLLTGAKAGPAAVASTKTPTQLLKGNWLLSGTFDVGTTQQRLTSAAGEQATVVETRETQQYSVSPGIGLLVGQRWVLGVSVPVSRRVQTNDFVRSAQTISGISSDVTTDAVGVVPFAKKYLTKARLGPFVGARFGWQRERTYGNGAIGNVVANTYQWRLSGGLAYLLSKRFIVEGELAGVGGQWSTSGVNNAESSQFDVTASLRPAFTLNYVLF